MAKETDKAETESIEYKGKLIDDLVFASQSIDDPSLPFGAHYVQGPAAPILVTPGQVIIKDATGVLSVENKK